MERKSKRYIYLMPLGYVAAILPWYLVVKYVLEVDKRYSVNLEWHAITIFLIIYVVQVIVNLKTGNLTEEERIELANIQITKAGKLFSFFVSIKGAVIIILLVSMVFITILTK